MRNPYIPNRALVCAVISAMLLCACGDGTSEEVLTVQASEVDDSNAPAPSDQKVEEAFGSPPLAMASPDEADAEATFLSASTNLP